MNKPQSSFEDHQDTRSSSLVNRIQSFFRRKPETDLRETLEEYIEEGDETPSISNHERVLLSNVLNLRDSTVVDVMVPRADIVAIDIKTSQEDLLNLLSNEQYSRLPVYNGSLDEVIGAIHIKDILGTLAQGEGVVIKDHVRELPIVSPSMQVLDLLLEMRETRKHMAIVVDEYGGVDGVVTIGDVIESILGEIDDEYDRDKPPELHIEEDGSVIADGRYETEVFEHRFGKILTDEEREDHETLGGVVFSLAGHVPALGEVLFHESGIEFEVLDVAPRHIKRLKIRNIPLLKK